MDQCPLAFRLTEVHKKVNFTTGKTIKNHARIYDFLKKHIYSKHPKDICEECEMAFEDQSAVDKHFGEVHEKMK